MARKIKATLPAIASRPPARSCKTNLRGFYEERNGQRDRISSFRWPQRHKALGGIVDAHVTANGKTISVRFA